MNETRKDCRRVDRRTFLRVTGTVGAGLLAGEPLFSDPAWGAQIQGETPEERAINGAKLSRRTST